MPPTGTLALEGSNGVSPSLALAHDLKLHEGVPPGGYGSSGQASINSHG